MKTHRTIVGAILTLMPLAVLVATPRVRLTKPPPGRWGIEDLWKATVISDTACDAWFEGFVFEETHGQVFRATTKPFPLARGTKVYGYRDVRIDQTQTAPGYEVFVTRNGQLPAGSYSFRLLLQPFGVGDSFGFEVRPMGLPRLIMPRDGDTVRTPYPLFVWGAERVLPVRVTKLSVTYELKLVEVLPGQLPDEAVLANPPWFRKTGITATSLQYPVYPRPLMSSFPGSPRLVKGAIVTVDPAIPVAEEDTIPPASGSPLSPKLVKGALVDGRRDLTHLDEKVQRNREYAWQVSAFTGGTKVGESEVWSFVISAGGSGNVTPPAVITPDTTVYVHRPGGLTYARPYGVWFTPPRVRPCSLRAVQFIVGDSGTSDRVDGFVRYVPRYQLGGPPLSTTGTLAREFTFQPGAQGETTAVEFNPPVAADTASDFLVCWASPGMAGAWPVDDIPSWSPPRSYRLGRIEKPWGDPEPLDGNLAVVAVFTSCETPDVIDAEVTAINAPTGQVAQGVTVIPQATVRNIGSDAVSFPVLFRIGTGYVDRADVTGLAPGAATTVSFRDWTAATIGTFAVKCTTMLSADSVPGNDWMTDSVAVTQPDTGGFTVELRWTDGTADCDLYLILPRAQGDTLVDTVAWFNRQAHGCMLDVDDTKGYGPEKIRGPIGSTMPDTARVWVHYYGPANGESTQASVVVFQYNPEKMTRTLKPQQWWRAGNINLRTGQVTLDPAGQVESRPDLSIPRK